METIKPINAITLLQNWLSKNNPMAIGTKFMIKDQDKTIVLVSCEGYPKGKFIYETGEDFDIAQNATCEFIPIGLEEERETIFDEELWDKVDAQLNGEFIGIDEETGEPIYKPLKIEDESKPLIFKTLGSPQKDEKFHDFEYYDVTTIIESLLKAENHSEINEQQKQYKQLIKYMLNNDYPVFTKEALYYVFLNCTFENTRDSNIKKVKAKGVFIGYLAELSEKYMFAPKTKVFEGSEYSYNNNQSLGFFYTAESYLDIALETIKLDKEKFVSRHSADSERNNEDYGYQASATIKTLLAFACECYLKSMLIQDGKKVEDVKRIGHGLTSLYTSLDDEVIVRIFNYMKKHGYKLHDSLRDATYEAKELADKYMLDLAKNDDAFVDARFSAESDKNTNYDFIYRFALALRECSQKKYRISSPFWYSIEKKLNPKKSTNTSTDNPNNGGSKKRR